MAVGERRPVEGGAGDGGDPTLLRLELPDRPGSLAIVAGVLGRCGVNILQLEVLSRRDGVAVDEFLVEDGSLDLALRRLGPYVTVRERKPHAQLPDPGAAMAAACASVAEAETPARARRALLDAAAELTRADAAVLLGDLGDGVGAQLGEGAVALLPVTDRPSLTLAAVRRDAVPFTPVELARLEGLLQVARGILGDALV
jgi:ACT domain